MFPLFLCADDIDYRLVLLVLSLEIGGRSGDLMGSVRRGITYVYQGSVIYFDWDSRNLNQ